MCTQIKPGMAFGKEVRRLIRNPIALRPETWGGKSKKDRMREKANKNVTY
tara:strand:+ start:2576 stop:2725 length:150 start_codon:yes stop_codon:yes gene_type:complete